MKLDDLKILVEKLKYDKEQNEFFLLFHNEDFFKFNEVAKIKPDDKGNIEYLGIRIVYSPFAHKGIITPLPMKILQHLNYTSYKISDIEMV